MKQEKRLFDAIGDLPEEQVMEAETHQFHKRHAWKTWTAIAAAALLVIGAGSFALRLFGAQAPGASAGGGGSELERYMAYYGPVFPLTSRDAADGLTATREIDFDFSPYETRVERYGDGADEQYETYDQQAVVTDRYTLTNSTDEDMTLSMLYPFAGSFSDPVQTLPAITADGQQVQSGLLAGVYAGGFSGVASPGADDSERWNLKQPASWLDYKTLIENGYLASALDGFPALDQPLVVYKFSDYVVPEMDVANVVLNVRFYLPEGAKVISYNSNGGTMNESGDYQERHVGGLNNKYRAPQPMYLAVLGGDLSDITTSGVYYDDDKKGSVDVTAAMTREETTLGAFIERIIEESDGYGWYFQPEQTEIYDALPDGMFLGCVAEMIESYGFLSDDPAERYDHGMIEDFLGETRSMKRLMYRTFDVTIPAHASVEVTAKMHKQANIDFVGENKDRNGYDLVTKLGSDLTFTAQWASVQHTEYVELLRDNFGFDFDAGVTRVQLNLTEPHYFLDVAKKSE